MLRLDLQQAHSQDVDIKGSTVAFLYAGVQNRASGVLPQFSHCSLVILTDAVPTANPACPRALLQSHMHCRLRQLIYITGKDRTELHSTINSNSKALRRKLSMISSSTVDGMSS